MIDVFKEINRIFDDAAPKPRSIYVEGCSYCEREKLAGNTHFPRHHASPRCESGKRYHCTCDTCF